MYAHYASRVVATCIRADLFRSLLAGPLSAAQIAEKKGFGNRATRATLEGLTALGLLLEEDDRYGLSEVARTYLIPGSPFYQGRVFKNVFDERILRAAADDRPLSEDWARWVAGRAGAMPDVFALRMHTTSFAPALAVARKGDFEGVTHLLDVAGGSGSMSIAIARQVPSLRATVLDLPEMCAEAARFLADFEMSDRVALVPGDMFADPWPDCDGIIFSNIFHDWNRERCALLAQKSFDTLAPGGRIYLHEMLLAEDGSGPLTTALYSLNLVPALQGRQYRFSELKQILGQAGFSDVTAVHSFSYFSLVTARKTVGQLPPQA